MNATEKTEQILQTVPGSQNNDGLLYGAYGNKFGGVNFTQEQIQRMMDNPPETISRIRRELQAKGLYPANKEVIDIRQAREAIYYNAYSKKQLSPMEARANWIKLQEMLANK